MSASVVAKQDARSLSAVAGRLYEGGPKLFGLLQRYRPYICPFEDLIAEGHLNFDNGRDNYGLSADLLLNEPL